MSDIRERIWSCLERCFFSQNVEEPTKSKGRLEADPKRGNNSSSHVLLMFLDCRSLQRGLQSILEGCDCLRRWRISEHSLDIIYGGDSAKGEMVVCWRELNWTSC